MKSYRVTGYDKRTGTKTTIIVKATTSKHARTVAYEQLTGHLKVERA